MADSNHVYAEIPVDAQVHSAQNASPEEIVKIAKTIWAEIRTSGVAKDDENGNDTLLETLQTKYKDFSTSFPLVLRWMVQMRKFHPEALKLYLMKHASTKLDSRESFLTLQAEYLVLLYRKTHRHADERFIKQYRKSVVEQLLEEDKAFADIQKEVEAEIAQKSTNNDQERRQLLYKMLLAQKVARGRASAAEPGESPD